MTIRHARSREIRRRANHRILVDPRRPLSNKPRGRVKTPGCGQRGGLPTSDRLEIVAPERNVRVGTLEDRHRCEFSHRLPMKLAAPFVDKEVIEL